MDPIQLDPQLRDAPFNAEPPLPFSAVIARGLLVPLRRPLRFFGFGGLVLAVLFLAFGLTSDAVQAFVLGLGCALTRLVLERLARREAVQGARVGWFTRQSGSRVW